MPEAGNDPLMNPVIQAATIAWLLRQAPGTNNSTQFYHFCQSNTMTKITQKEVLIFLRSHGHAIGEEHLGFHPLEIGNKSIRSGTAMGSFLGGERCYHIKK